MGCMYIDFIGIPKMYELNYFFIAFQEYERMNVADALITKAYGDGDLIIKQVRL